MPLLGLALGQGLDAYQQGQANQMKLKQAQRDASFQEQNQANSLQQDQNSLAMQNQRLQELQDAQEQAKETRTKDELAGHFAAYNLDRNDSSNISNIGSIIKDSPMLSQNLNVRDIQPINPNSKEDNELLNNFITSHGIKVDNNGKPILGDDTVIVTGLDGQKRVGKMDVLEKGLNLDKTPQAALAQVLKNKATEAEAKQTNAESNTSKAEAMNDKTPAGIIKLTHSLIDDYMKKGATFAEARKAANEDIDRVVNKSTVATTDSKNATTERGQDLTLEGTKYKADRSVDAASKLAQFKQDNPTPTDDQKHILEGLHNEVKFTEKYNLNKPSDLQKASLDPEINAVYAQESKRLSSSPVGKTLLELDKHKAEFNTLAQTEGSRESATGMMDNLGDKYLAGHLGVNFNKNSQLWRHAYSGITSDIRHALYGSALTYTESSNFKEFISSTNQSDQELKVSMITLLRNEINNYTTVRDSFVNKATFDAKNKMTVVRLKELLTKLEKGK